MKKTVTVSELFAGVGGFRVGLETVNNKKGTFKTVWANQWEPPGSDAKQFAWRCYETQFVWVMRWLLVWFLGLG